MALHILALLVIMAASPVVPRLVELSYTYNVDAPTSPKLKPFKMTVLQNGTNDLGIWVELNEFCTSEHSGTHVDAPAHYARDTWPVNEIPLERLWRVPGVVIDVSQAISAAKERNFAIPVSELDAWESRHGVIPDRTVVFIRTGWGAKSHNLAEYSGLDNHRRNNFPGLSKEAATWLATHGARHGHPTGVVGVGVDTISVDVGNSTHYEAHQAMYSRNVYGMENLANLDQLPTANFLVTVMPMRIGGGSGAPARIIAELPDEHTATSPRLAQASEGTRLSAELPFLLMAAVVGPLLRHLCD
ncbi:isatin hydrolase-like isoform X3 [Portunus trituberculatus]|nr:isatin hydrolase-like isoform X3 [Portunus trituberculatus]XP_045111556.1 isatin hydrolase-like isoform X3 [Portunus trituberculatus]